MAVNDGVLAIPPPPRPLLRRDDRCRPRLHRILAAACSAESLTVEIHKTGGAQSGCQWVRYVVGRPHTAGLPLDVTIEMSGNALHVSAAEVFDAEEAADLFLAYHQSGDIPAAYSRRPVEGYGPDGSMIDIYNTEPAR